MWAYVRSSIFIMFITGMALVVSQAASDALGFEKKYSLPDVIVAGIVLAGLFGLYMSRGFSGEFKRDFPKKKKEGETQ